MRINDSLQIANLLEEMGFLLELEAENQFKVRAHAQAALRVRGWTDSVEALVQAAQGGKLAGVGTGLAEKVTTLASQGTHPELESLRSRIPQGVRDLAKVSGLGPKKIRTLWKDLGVLSLTALGEACLSHRVAKLKGFGAKSEQKILNGVQQVLRYQGMLLLPDAEAASETIKETLERGLGGAYRIEQAGEVRRSAEVVQCLHFVVQPPVLTPLHRTLGTLATPQTVESQSAQSLKATLPSGTQIEITGVDEEQFGASLILATGSSEHLKLLAARAQSMGLQFQDGILSQADKRLPCPDEQAFYRALKLCLIPPECREGGQEVQWAEQAFERQEQFPELVARPHLLGMLHLHTTYSDGRHSLREMALAARAEGYEYLGVSDHSRSAAYAGGLSIERVQEQQAEIRKLNRELAPFTIFSGIESDILKDGALDYPDEVLKCFDFVIASVHSNFALAPADMTARLIRAVENPYTTILGHPSGRLLLTREGYPFDIAAVMKSAAENRVAIELNANPYRLDLDWRHLPAARALQIKIPICPDAHAIEGYQDVRWGLKMARKGLCRPRDILNCLSRDEFRQWCTQKATRMSSVS